MLMYVLVIMQICFYNVLSFQHQNETKHTPQYIGVISSQLKFEIQIFNIRRRPTTPEYIGESPHNCGSGDHICSMHDCLNFAQMMMKQIALMGNL